jgi:hypothetical protein
MKEMAGAGLSCDLMCCRKKLSRGGMIVKQAESFMQAAVPNKAASST